jgi:putative tryptophan/tyrosine transport system substrate-binding protein
MQRVRKMTRRKFLAATLASPLAGPVALHTGPAGNLRRIGLVGLADESPWGAFCEGLRERGWIEGRNIIIHRRFADERNGDRLSSHVDDLIRLHVEVIVAARGAAILARYARSRIPVVFLDFQEWELEPIGLVENLARPEGYVTGVTTVSSLNTFIPGVAPKIRAHLEELLPWGDVVALLCRPENILDEQLVRDLRAAAAAFGVHLGIVKAHSAKELKHAFARMAATRTSAFVVTTNPRHWSIGQSERIAALARRCNVTPAHSAVLPGLIRYESDLREHFHEGASYVDRLLKGATPAELPVRRTDKLELVANCCAATVHDIPIPASLLARAGRIIPFSGPRLPPWRALRRELWKDLKRVRG